MGAVALASAAVWLAAAAWRSDVAMYGHASATVVGDVATGLAFVVAGAAGRGPAAQRVLVALVGLAWLAGSVWGWAVPLHQAALLLMLAAHPFGRLRAGLPLFGLVAGAAMAVAIPGPVIVAVAFGIEAALVAWTGARGLPRRRAYTGCAAVLLAGVLVHAHWLGATARPAEPGVYQTAMCLVALGFVVATWLGGIAPESLSRQLIGDDGAAGMGGLAAVLGALLRDPRLEVVGGAVGSGLAVRVAGEVVATVRSTSPLLADPVVVAAVQRSVRLVVEHQRLRAADERRLTGLAAARLRLIGAVDRERALVTEALSDRVSTPVAAAAAQLAEVPRVGEAGLALDTVAESLGAVQAELSGLVRGVPAVALGHGRLAAAFRTLADGSPVPVAVVAEGAPWLSAPVEAALFFIGREAVVNAVKHAAAGRIEVRLAGGAGSVVLEISDDGRGGADAAGAGLSGLADRAGAIGASVAIGSPPGGGTRVVVRLPVPATS
ncbi:ATP-binding protein [Pseudofrankia sp. BMG5.37]|uniref:sensor histidine kinase n=1 Tax=Pseudofrankia sp. BMG5.37 TaxID=3050035 RepID=UPI0028943CFD|nr:ATP-binding protein [Pseudofrankia sp. BMG5.37]MDT3442689.1 hypothetical protein [Pseudofrankia sp. BMG5.37]